MQATPLERLNAILLFGRTDQAIDEAARWIARLDATIGKDQGSLWVYKPKNVSAEALSVTLNEVLGNGARPEAQPSRTNSSLSAGSGFSNSLGAPPPPRPAPAASRQAAPTTEPDIRVSVDRDSNSLVIAAPASKRADIQRLLLEIDVLPRQVLIEASILEVTLSDGFRLGVNWSIFANSGRLQVVQTSDQSGFISPTLPGIAVTYMDNNVEAAIDALSARTSVKVVSAPKLVALDNRMARLRRLPQQLHLSGDLQPADQDHRRAGQRDRLRLRQHNGPGDQGHVSGAGLQSSEARGADDVRGQNRRLRLRGSAGLSPHRGLHRPIPSATQMASTGTPTSEMIPSIRRIRVGCWWLRR